MKETDTWTFENHKYVQKKMNKKVKHHNKAFHFIQKDIKEKKN